MIADILRAIVIGAAVVLAIAKPSAVLWQWLTVAQQHPRRIWLMVVSIELFIVALVWNSLTQFGDPLQLRWGIYAAAVALGWAYCIQNLRAYLEWKRAGSNVQEIADHA